MRILCAEPLLARNTLALPATAEALVEVGSEGDLHEALQWARSRDLPVTPLGEGSNVVFAGDLPGLALRLANRGIEILDRDEEGVLLRVAAGENWHGFVQWCLEQGYYGLENLALIPGSVGAAPVQNIGAYGVELDSVLERVHAIRLDNGDSIALSVADCDLAYRDSAFKGRLRDQVAITAVELNLSLRREVNVAYPALSDWLQERGVSEPTPADVFEAVVSIRRSKLPDPATQPNAGSFFKNPVVSAERARAMVTEFPGLPVYPHVGGTAKLPAAWLIDQCGWRGHREGGVGVHPEHALVIVHYGGADGRAVMALAERIARSVVERFDIRLEIEPRVYGA